MTGYVVWAILAAIVGGFCWAGMRTGWALLLWFVAIVLLMSGCLHAAICEPTYYYGKSEGC